MEATNPQYVDVTNGQAALLQLERGFAVIIPKYIRHDHIPFRVFFSTNSEFKPDAPPLLEAIAPAAGATEIRGVRVFVGYGGENITSVSLDTGDADTGMAVLPTNDLSRLDVSQIRFQRGKRLNPEDLMKAVGADRLMSRTNGVK